MHPNDTNKKFSVEIIYPELSYSLTGLCYEIHNRLERFCRERQYGDEFEKLLKEKDIRYKRKYSLSHLGKEVVGNIVDFMIDEVILVDLKAKKFITKDDYYQMLRYLQASNLKLGLLINFRNSHLKPKRTINLYDS